MASTFGWLDYSDGDRRRVLDVVRSLSEKETRDELGVASVRDALANLLAPGASTIQTRVRYFLFIPWIYQQLEARVRKRSVATSKEQVARWARHAEVELIGHLLGSDDAEGTIGAWSGKSLQRLPSNVYWNGLAAWGIRWCPWSVDDYHHRLAVHGPPELRGADDAWGAWPNWHPGLPEAPEGFPEGASMVLESAEAEYLRERILETQPGSLLGQLVLGGASVADLEYPWSVLDHGIELPADVANVVRHAREFSLAMYGAVLIYNLMLAEAREPRRSDWVDRYRGLIDDWTAELDARGGAIGAWDRADFWQTVERAGSSAPLGSRQFINAWLDRLLDSDDPAALADDPAVRNLIDNREQRLKKTQARLHNPRMLEAWNGETGSGVVRMNYRWPVLRGHVTDILDAIEEGKEAQHAGTG